MYRNLLNLLLLAFIIPSSSLIGACTIGNETVAEGDKIMGACCPLVCSNGQFVERDITQPHPCCYTCIVRDDPHTLTFDNCKYEAMTECVVSLLQTGRSYNPALALFVKFEQCPSPFQHKTCLSTMVFKPQPNYYIKFDPATWNDKFVTVGRRNGANAEYEINIVAVSDTHTTDVGISDQKSIMAWFNHDCFHMLTYRGMWFIYCQKHNGLHSLTIHTPHQYAPETHGLCNKYLPAGKQFSRNDVNYCNNMTDAFKKDFIENWGAIEDTCHLPEKRKVNLRTQNFDCPEGEQEMVRQRCLDSLRDIEMTEEARETQTRFCMVDICNLVGNKAPAKEVSQYLRATHDAVKQIVAQNVYSLREGRSHDCDFPAYQVYENQIYNAIEHPEPINDDTGDKAAVEACKQ